MGGSGNLEDSKHQKEEEDAILEVEKCLNNLSVKEETELDVLQVGLQNINISYSEKSSESDDENDPEEDRATRTQQASSVDAAVTQQVSTVDGEEPENDSDGDDGAQSDDSYDSDSQDDEFYTDGPVIKGSLIERGPQSARDRDRNRYAPYLTNQQQQQVYTAVHYNDGSTIFTPITPVLTTVEQPGSPLFYLPPTPESLNPSSPPTIPPISEEPQYPSTANVVIDNYHMPLSPPNDLEVEFGDLNVNDLWNMIVKDYEASDCRVIMPMERVQEPLLSSNPISSIFKDVPKDKIRDVKKLIDSKSDDALLIEDEDGDNALLQVATGFGDDKDVEVLLQFCFIATRYYKINPNLLTKKNNKEWTALWTVLALKQLKPAIFFLHLVLKADLPIKSIFAGPCNNSPLHNAVMKNDYEMVRTLLYVVKSYHSHLVKECLNIENDDGSTALHSALRNYKKSPNKETTLEIIKILLQEADLTKKDGKNQENYVHFTVKNTKDPHLLRVVLNFVPSQLINDVDQVENTSLHYAATMNDVDVVTQEDIISLLLEAGALRKRNKSGSFPTALVAREREGIKKMLQHHRNVF